MASGMTFYDNAGTPVDVTGENLIVSDVSKAPGSERVVNMVKISQADYDAIVTKDPLIMYMIVG